MFGAAANAGVIARADIFYKIYPHYKLTGSATLSKRKCLGSNGGGVQDQ
jgi:hypothetical protein